MSLYNMLFGQNPMTDFILATLGLTTDDCGRFRNVFVANGEIAVYTRHGGGNREWYQYVFDELATHPLYKRDEDDDFDCTYATIYFSLPEQWKDELTKMESGTFHPSEEWRKKIASIEQGELTPAMEAFGKRLIDTLQSGQGGVIEV